MSQPDQFNRQTSIENLTSTHIKVIANGFVLRTRYGQYFYPNEKLLLEAVADYLKVVVKDYSRLLELGKK